MPSTAIDSQIHGCMFSTDEMRRIWSDESWAQKWLDTEAALAKAQGELGVIPQEKADLINAYAKAELLDIPSIGEFYKVSPPKLHKAEKKSWRRSRPHTKRAALSGSFRRAKHPGQQSAAGFQFQASHGSKSNSA